MLLASVSHGLRRGMEGWLECAQDVGASAGRPQVWSWGPHMSGDRAGQLTAGLVGHPPAHLHWIRHVAVLPYNTGVQQSPSHLVAQE